MKLKITGYDDENEIVTIINIMAGEEFLFEKATESIEKYIKSYNELEECEDCRKKLMYFHEQLPHNHVCKDCVRNSPKWQKQLIPSNEL